MVGRMVRSRFENLEPDRQHKLMESAAEEFSAKGYDAASLNRILERSGMSKSSLYYYFDDKADLFTTLVQRSMAVLFRKVGAFDVDALTVETYWSECEALYSRCIDIVSGDAWYIRLGRMFYRLRGSGKPGASTDRMFDVARGWLDALLARGQALGVVRTDMPRPLLTDCAMGVGEALDRWVVAHWDDLDNEARHRMAGEHIELFRRLLSP